MIELIKAIDEIPEWKDWFAGKHIAYRIEKNLNGDEFVSFRRMDVTDDENILAFAIDFRNGNMVKGTNPVGNGVIECGLGSYLNKVRQCYEETKDYFNV